MGLVAVIGAKLSKDGMSDMVETKLEDLGVNLLDEAIRINIGLANIRSSIMSHITFKICPFVLIIYLRDYQYDFDLDIVVLWSCYGVLRLTYTTYQNLCPTYHFIGRLLMSQDICPTWIVLLESIYRIIEVYFRISPLSK